MTEYSLTRHAFIARRGDALVVLDLKNDEYVLLEGNLVDVLLRGEPATDKALQDIDSLMARGILTRNTKEGKPLRLTQREIALDHLMNLPNDALSTRIGFRDYAKFIISCVWAAIQLRIFHVSRIVHRVESRKLRAEHPIDLPRARMATGIFHKLRHLFPANYLCLYDSLALLEFLARYDVHPSWVFGVSLEPWGAHCWIQEGPLIFNEDVEESANFTPVMIV